MQSAVLCAAIPVLAVIAYGDIRSRRIPNALCVVIAALGMVRISAARDALTAGYTLLAAAAVFAGTFLLFWRGVIGGGDAKLITAIALVIGHRDLLGFLFLMSLFGGVLGVVALARDKFVPKLARLRFAATGRSLALAVDATQGETTVAYGLAIATAGAITLIFAK